QLRRRRRRAVRLPPQTGDSAIPVDDPRGANAGILIDVQTCRRLHGSGRELPALLVDPQRADDTVALKTPFQPTAAVLAGGRERTVVGATGQPRLDVAAVAGVCDGLVPRHGDVQR